MSKNRILPFEAILSKSGESWVVGGVASNFFRDLDGDAIAPDAIARAIPAFMANRGPDGLKGGPLRLHHGFWERFLKQSINSLNIPYADQMGMLAAIALPLGRVTEMTVEPDGTTRWRGLLSQANPIARVIWEMLKEGLVHLGVSVGGKINATRPGRDALGRPCTVICDVRLDELSITDNPANRLIESEAADNGAYIMALAKSLQTTVSPSPVDQFLEQVLGDDLSKAARQKMQEGATRMKNGRQQVLKNSRWRNTGSGNSSQGNVQSGKPTAHELKQAYRQSARAHHPDHGGSREKFDQVRAAYERMMDDHYPDLKKSLIPYKTTMAKVNRFLRKALGGSPGGEINSGSWRDTAIPSMGRGLASNPTNKPTGTKQVRLDASSSDTAARGIGGKQPKAQRPYSSGGMPPTDVWGMTVGQLTRELSKCCGMSKEAWGSPETSGFLTDAAHGLVGLTESPNPELINFVRFLQYMNQFAQQLPHMDDYQAAGTVAAMNTDLTKALSDFTETLPAELKGRPLRPPGSPGVRGIDIQFPSQYIVYS